MTEREQQAQLTARELDRLSLKRLEPIARDFRDQFEAAAPEERGSLARALLHAGIQILQRWVGDEALKAAYGETPSAGSTDREKLATLAMRLWLVHDVFPMDRSDSDASILAAWKEVHAISQGDKPILFAGSSGTKGRDDNAYQLARHKLRALEWEKFLRACGMRAGRAQSEVGAAYGETWGTMRKWRSAVEREIGSESMARDLRLASRPQWVMVGRFRNEDDARKALARDGAVYRREYRRGR